MQLWNPQRNIRAKTYKTKRVIYRTKYVDKNRKSYTIAGNSFGSSVYTTALNTSTGDLMYSAAKHAKGLAADAQKESSYDSAGRQSVQHAIQTVTQYMYKFGKEVGIY